MNGLYHKTTNGLQAAFYAGQPEHHRAVLFSGIGNEEESTSTSKQIPTLGSSEDVAICSEIFSLPNLSEPGNRKYGNISVQKREKIAAFLSERLRVFFKDNQRMAIRWLEERAVKDIKSESEENDDKATWLRWALLEVWANTEGLAFPLIHDLIKQKSTSPLFYHGEEEQRFAHIERCIQERMQLAKETWYKWGYVNKKY